MYGLGENASVTRRSESPDHRGRHLRFVLFLVLLSGCATNYAASPFRPKSINEVPFRDRSQSEFDNDVRVTTAVPTAEETEAIFGANLAGKEIQPVWVKVENHSDRTYYLVSASVDPNHYYPWGSATAWGFESNLRHDRR